jgi:ectoine hydroxylase-related dioxygenase (phytanoyl-CoA dioxygenase family)
MSITARPRCDVSVADFVQYQENGFLIMRAVVAPSEVEELLGHIDELADPSLLRVHMLHRQLPIHERYLLHPRILDVVQALVGPDVLALQTMLFLKPPGSPGQGYHQDSFHIQTSPDSLIGAWMALEPVDDENGCLWIAGGSNHEPVYPDGSEHHRPGGHRLLSDIEWITGSDDPDENRNALTRVARRYAAREVPVELEPGDVAFFAGRVLHRSHANRSTDRYRRSFVAHYCNARSFVPWDDPDVPAGQGANDRHILARGSTHLPYATPKFGTPVELS